MYNCFSLVPTYTCEEVKYHKLIFWNCLIQTAGLIKCEMQTSTRHCQLSDIACPSKYILSLLFTMSQYRGADKSLARPGRKQATVTEVFEFHVSYL